MILGLDRPTSGAALVNGRPYVHSPAPMAEVGALLDAGAVDSGRSARNHLLALGATVGIGPRRVDDVLASVGLGEVAHKSAGSFSLGMGQRLGIAAALLADPPVLILDEPVNGLDLDGIQWIRALITELAQEGRTVLLSSHLMSEMQLVADHLLIIGQGRILADTPMDDFIEHASGGVVVVASPDAGELAPLLAGEGATLTSAEAGRFEVNGLTADQIGDIAAEHGFRLHQLAPRAASLESAYYELTGTASSSPRPPAYHPPAKFLGAQPHDDEATTTAVKSTSRRTEPTTTTHRQTLGRAIRSEWIKLRTLRNTWIGMGAVVLLLVGLGAIAAAVNTGSVTTPEEGGGFGPGDPLSTVLLGADFAVLLIGVLGAMTGAQEYGSRMIMATIAAVPRRWQIVVSKAIVLTVVVLPTAVIGVLAAFVVGMGILSAGGGATVALTDDGVLSSVLGMAAYLTAIALMGLGLGILLRSAASSIGILIGGIIVLPTLAGFLLPASLDSVLQFLPSSAAAAFTTVRGAGDEVLDATAGAVVLAAWVAVTLGAAVVLITRRDA